jgi:hypothetical protein
LRNQRSQVLEAWLKQQSACIVTTKLSLQIPVPSQTPNQGNRTDVGQLKTLKLERKSKYKGFGKRSQKGSLGLRGDARAITNL